MTATRIGAIAANGYREVIRDRVLYLGIFFAVVLLAALTFVPRVAAGADDKIILDVGLGAIGLLSTVIAVFVGTGLLNKEIEKRTVLVLIPKPITRLELMVGKHLGLCGVLLSLVAIMAAVYLGLLSLFGISYPFGSILVSLAFLMLELALLVAVTLMFGSFTNSLLAMLLSFGVYFMGHLSQDLLELGEVSDNEGLSSTMRALYFILPDLSRLNLRNEAVYGILPPVGELFTHAVYGGLYTVLLLCVAIVIFSRRQF